MSARSRWWRSRQALIVLPLVATSGALPVEAFPPETGRPPDATVRGTASTLSATTAPMPGDRRPGRGLRGMRLPLRAGLPALPLHAVPAEALDAYRQAALIGNRADRNCNLHWSMLAAIGRVESDHGRVDDNVLDPQGRVRPGIYGPALDGSDGTALVRDTDGGAVDTDTVYDRAVGPMQFIPATWSAAGVDADQNGARNPQDIDDAAAAAAVYLCAGRHDLETATGRRAAVHRYNHSVSYVQLVLRVAAIYAGGYTAVLGGTPWNTTLVPPGASQQSTARPSAARGQPVARRYKAADGSSAHRRGDLDSGGTQAANTANHRRGRGWHGDHSGDGSGPPNEKSGDGSGGDDGNGGGDRPRSRLPEPAPKPVHRALRQGKEITENRRRDDSGSGRVPTDSAPPDRDRRDGSLGQQPSPERRIP